VPKTLAQRFFQKSRSATLSVSPISGHGTRRHESSSRHSTILACKQAEIKRKTDLKRLIFPLKIAETEKEFKTTEKAKKDGQRGWENAHVHMVKTCRGFTPMLSNSDLRISPSKTECLRCCCCGRCGGTCFVGSISTTVERSAITCTEV
jgi:hypothetical protein